MLLRQLAEGPTLLAGQFGCPGHIARGLIEQGMDVLTLELTDRLFLRLSETDRSQVGVGMNIRRYRIAVRRGDDHGRFGQQVFALDKVLEFSNVARPAVDR